MQERGYDRLDQTLLRVLQSINQRPTAGDIHALQLVEQRIRLLESGIGVRGFLPLPTRVLTGEFTIGNDAISSVPVRARHAHLARTTLISGTTGSGKTTLLHHLIAQAREHNVSVWTIDAESDSQANAVNDDRTLIIDADAPVNLLQRPTFLTRAEHQAVFTSVFTRSFFSGEHGRQVVSTAFDKLAEYDTLADMARIVDAAQIKSDTYAQRDAMRGVLLRLQRIGQLYPGLYTTRHGLRIEDLCRRSLYMPVKIQTEVDEFIFTYLIHLLFLYQRERNTRPELSHLIHMDEGMLSWNRNTNKIDGVPLLSYLQSMVREFGIGMLISTTSIHLLDPLLKSNSFIRIALNVTDHMEAIEIARTFGLTMPQREYFSRGLTRGEAIIKFADEWTDPILAAFSARHEPKTVSLAE